MCVCVCVCVCVCLSVAVCVCVCAAYSLSFSLQQTTENTLPAVFIQRFGIILQRTWVEKAFLVINKQKHLWRHIRGRKWSSYEIRNRGRIGWADGGSVQLLQTNAQRFRGGFVFKAHRLCVSLISRFESNKEEEKCSRTHLPEVSMQADQVHNLTPTAEHRDQ